MDHFQAMAPLPGVVQIQGDISPSCPLPRRSSSTLRAAARPSEVCDGAPDVTGLHGVGSTSWSAPPSCSEHCYCIPEARGLLCGQIFEAGM